MSCPGSVTRKRHASDAQCWSLYLGRALRVWRLPYFHLALWLHDDVGPAAAPWVGEIFITDRFLSNLDFFFF